MTRPRFKPGSAVIAPEAKVIQLISDIDIPYGYPRKNFLQVIEINDSEDPNQGCIYLLQDPEGNIYQCPERDKTKPLVFANSLDLKGFTDELEF